MTKPEKVVPVNECVIGTALYERIDKIIKLIPDGLLWRQVIVNSLEVPQRLIRSTSPVAMVDRWDEVSRIIEREFPKPWTTDFERKIARVFHTTVNLTPIRKHLVS